MAGGVADSPRRLSTHFQLFDDSYPESRFWEFHDEHDLAECGAGTKYEW